MPRHAENQLKRVDPRTLKKHLYSIEVYGEKSDDDFDESIANNIMVSPIIVAADGETIVSGVRRRYSAIKAGIEEVEVVVNMSLVDDLDIRNAIVEANRTNPRPPESIARELKARREIEEEKAERDKKEGSRANWPAGRARDRAAKQMGVSPRTGERMTKVVEAIDEAEEKGDKEKASRLRTALNEKSVRAAYQEAVTSNKEAWEELAEKHRAWHRDLMRIRREVESVGEEKAGSYLKHAITRILKTLKDVAGSLRQLEPVGKKGRTIVTRIDDERSKS